MRIRHGLIAVLLVLCADATRGQGTRADYERAARLRSQRNPIPNERIETIWLDEQRLVFRDQRSAEQWEFVEVRPADGTRRPAFDHALVAARGAALLERDLDPRRLPLRRFTLHDGQLVALCGDPPAALAIDADGRTVRRLPLDAIEAFRPPPITRRRSRDRGGETSLEFINRSGTPVEIIWLDRAGRERRYATLEDGQRHGQHTFDGHVWLVRATDGRELGLYEAGADAGILNIRAPEQGTQPTSRPAPGPTEPRVSIEDDNVVLHPPSGPPVALSRDGTPQDAYTGQHALSPDGTRLLVVRAEPAETHRIHLVEARPDGGVQPVVHELDYLKPGDRIARPRLALFDLPGRRAIPVSDALLPNPWSLDHLHWSADGRECYALYNERGHQRLRVLAIAAEDGAVRTVLEETSPTFIDYASKLHLQHLEEENALLWMSERSGWNHLYRVDRRDGEIRPVTAGAWAVRGVERVDPVRREVTFRAVGVDPDQDPYHEHYGRVSLDGGPVTWLTEGDGTHTVRFSPDGRYYVDTYSRVDAAPVHELRRTADGGLVLELARADLAPLRASGWRAPERFVATGRDGRTDIWGVLFYPSNFDPARRYPVIENIYAGPHGHFVPKAFRRWHGSREIAELGFIVVRIDGMGTNWRSKAFHDVCWKNLGDSGFPDRIRWIRAAAAERPFMDLDRVGIYGGSAGGQSALRALLAHGDFYHAAVADCGCHDNRMDKIWWNELWMGWPLGEHYAAQSNVTCAKQLTGDLLLIVGALDRNVDPSSTMQVVDALIEADKDFELLVMPSAGHGAAETDYGRRRRQDFFVRHLLGVAPRAQ